MQIVLQFGYGMRPVATACLKSWGGGTAILSPRDMNPSQVKGYADAVNSIKNCSVLLDPQCYSKESTHPRLHSHGYWPKDFSTKTMTDATSLQNLLLKLLKINEDIEAKEMILPLQVLRDTSMTTKRRLQAIVEAADSLKGAPPYRVSIPVGVDILKDTDNTSELIELLRGIPLKRIYFVAEREGASYWVEDSTWIENVLHLCADFRMRGIDTILGHGNPQMLVVAATGCRSVATGTWSNVRSFSLKRLNLPEESALRTTQWLYVDGALAEIKKKTVAKAYENGKLKFISKYVTPTSPQIKALMKSGDASGILTRTVSFLHYLEAMRMQADAVPDDSFTSAYSAVEGMFSNASAATEELLKNGISGENRDPTRMINASVAALKSFRSKRGAVLLRSW